jgi:hypothetical protein
LHWNNRKDSLRASQELIRPHTSHGQEYERENSFDRLSLEKASPGQAVPDGPHEYEREHVVISFVSDFYHLKIKFLHFYAFCYK